jgi:ATP-binding cassette subfamily F protein 3
LTPQGGERRLGHNVKAGYYSQYRLEQLHEDATVLEEALDTPQRVGEQFARTVLGGFLFRGDDVFKRVSVLSGGEKSRLALVKLLLDPPNLLLMDEPTTHLDISSTDALLAALQPFEGTLVFISHDVYFLRELATHVVHVKDGRVTPYPGGYQYYLDKTAQAATAAAVSAASVSAPPEPGESAAERERLRKRREAEQRQERTRQRRQLQERVTRLEEDIHRVESRQKELTAEMEVPETYEQSGRAMEINREFLDHAERLQALSAEWEAAATELHRLEAAG